MTRVACGSNFSHSFLPKCLILCKCFCNGLKMCICFWDYPILFFINFFYFFDIVFQVRLVLKWYLVDATHPTVFDPSFLYYAYLFYMVWRRACAFGVILAVFLLFVFPLFWLSFSRSNQFWNRYLVGVTPPRIFYQSLSKCADLFYMVWRYACSFGISSYTD